MVRHGCGRESQGAEIYGNARLSRNLRNGWLPCRKAGGWLVTPNLGDTVSSNLDKTVQLVSTNLVQQNVYDNLSESFGRWLAKLNLRFADGTANAKLAFGKWVAKAMSSMAGSLTARR